MRILTTRNHWVRILLTAFVLLTLTGVTLAQSTQSQTRFASNVAPQSTYTICSDVAILPGYAVVEITSNAGCKYAIQYTIQPAANNLEICSGTPVPEPFVVVKIQSVPNNQCNGQQSISTIYTVQNGSNVCSGTPIPSGWSYTKISSSNGQCGTLTWYEVHPSAAGLQICSTSPFDAPYVVTSINSSISCNGLRSYTLANVYDGIQACSVGAVPAGYVIPRADHLSVCGDYYAHTLKEAYDGVVVCPFSPIPDHYYKDISVPVTNCEGYSSGYRLVYIP